MKTTRIFISSPGDVAEERQKACQVIGILQKRYGANVKLQPILWEDLPLQADISFQKAIDLILSKQGVDIAVFIIWSRVGSRPGGITKPDGSSYRSGTDRELDLMLQARASSPENNKRPDILVYTRDDDEAFASLLTAAKSDNDELESLVQQKKQAQEFITEHFTDEKGTNIRAYHTFPKPVDFASRLKVHLTNLLDEQLIDVPTASLWEGNPYMGLNSFQPEHAPVFFGREKETADLAALLRARERDPRDGCAFACVVGASGSGKSSLVRAGLASELQNFSLENDQSKQEWNFLALTPRELLPRFALQLILHLADLFPSLVEHTSVDDLAETLEKNPTTFLKISLDPAIKAKSENAQSPQKTLLLIDQFEEFFTLPEFKNSHLLEETLVPLLQTLAQSKYLWVVATLRADFYSAAQFLPGFLELRGSKNFDLLPPSISDLRRIITRPAALAGASFESLDPNTRTTLADHLLDEINQQPNSLPLLQFTLAELYDSRDSNNLLSKDAYETLGGLSGAVNKRAEKTLEEVESRHSPEGLQKTFPHFFSKFFTIDFSSGVETPVRRPATENELFEEAPHPEITQDLLEAFTNNRLFTVNEVNQYRTYSVAHETILRDWPRLIDLRSKEAENLRRRSRLEPSQRTYATNPHPSHFLPNGLPLNEASQLLNESPHILTPELKSYIQNSQSHNQKKKHNRTILITSTVLILSILAALATLAFLDAREQKKIALAEKQKAEEVFIKQKKLHKARARDLLILTASRQDSYDTVNDLFKAYPLGIVQEILDDYYTVFVKTRNRTSPEQRTAAMEDHHASALETIAFMKFLAIARQETFSFADISAINRSLKIFNEGTSISENIPNMKLKASLAMAIALRFEKKIRMPKNRLASIPPQFRAILMSSLRTIFEKKKKITLSCLATIQPEYEFYQTETLPLIQKIESLQWETP